MAKKSANFIDLHAEKVVLGIGVLALLAAGVYSFGGLRFKVNNRGPADLVEEAGKQADTTARMVAGLQPPKPGADSTKKAGDGNTVSDWIRDGKDAIFKLAKIDPKLWRTQKFPPIRTDIAGVAPEDRRELVQAVGPGVPIVMSDRTTFEMTEPRPFEEIARFPDATPTGAKSVVRSFVSVGAQVDLSELDSALSRANYPPKTRCLVVGVQLQRRDESEPWRGWETVDTYVPYKPLERPVDARGIKIDALRTFKDMIELGKKIVTRPDLPSKRVTYPPLPGLDESLKSEVTFGGESKPKSEEQANRRVKKWVELGKKALAGKKPFLAADVDAAYMLAQAAVAETNAGQKEAESATKLLEEVKAKVPKARLADWKGSPQSADQLMPLMAHDFDVTPGHTYVYRLRYELLNPSAGIGSELKNSKDAEVLTVFSDWSPPSRPVEVTSDLVFFLTQADPKKKDVTITVYRKRPTGWKDQEYKIRIGEVIGQKEKIGKNKGVDFATGMICVDLDFSRVDPAPGGKKTVVMVYVDPGDGKLREKYLSRDLKDKDKIIKQLADQPTAMK